MEKIQFLYLTGILWLILYGVCCPLDDEKHFCAELLRGLGFYLGLGHIVYAGYLYALDKLPSLG